MVALIEQPPAAAWVNPSAVAIWDAVADVLARHLDPRSARRLRALPWLFDRASASPFTARPRLRASLRLRELLEGFDDREPPLTDVDRAGCAELRARLATSPDRGSDLLDAIHAHPDDRAARAVYADWLIEQGDPRGEFIALQLARAVGDRPSPREVSLLRAHDKVWLAGLVRHLRARTFENGFLVECAFDARLGAPPLDDRLATVERLGGWFDAPAAVDVLFDPVWRALRQVGTLSIAGLERLAAAPRPLPLERLTVHLESPIPPDLDAPTLPTLRTLRLSGNVSDALARALFATPLIARIRDVHAEWAVGSLAGWVDAFAAAPTALGALELRWNQFWEFSLARRAGGVVVDARVGHGGYDPATAVRYGTMIPEVFGWLTDPAAGVVTAALATVRLHDTRWNGTSPSSIATLRDSLARLTAHPVDLA